MQEVTIMRGGDLERQVWKFGFAYWNYRPEFVLEYYAVESRATKRSKWRPTDGQKWSRLFSRDNKIDFDDVPKPDDVEQEALEKARAMIKIEWEAKR